MDSKHTPGPWSVIPATGLSQGFGISMSDPEGARYATVAVAEAGNTLYSHLTIGIEARRANAYLIAAAPEMLEALRAALPWVGALFDTQRCADVKAAVRAAIAKAEGPQS